MAPGRCKSLSINILQQKNKSKINRFFLALNCFFAYLIYMNLILDNLKIDQVDYVDSNVVNVFCLFDSGKGYYEGGLGADVVVREEEGYILVDAVKIDFVEDENEDQVEFSCDAKALENKLENLLDRVLHSPLMNENEAQLIEALK